MHCRKASTICNLYTKQIVSVTPNFMPHIACLTHTALRVLHLDFSVSDYSGLIPSVIYFTIDYMPDSS